MDRKNFEGSTGNQFERILIQVARVLLFKPKVILLLNDFYTGIKNADEYTLNILKVNITGSCMISVVEEYEYLKHFSRVGVMDRGVIMEIDSYTNLKKTKNSYLNKIIKVNSLNMPSFNMDGMDSPQFRLKKSSKQLE